MSGILVPSEFRKMKIPRRRVLVSSAAIVVALATTFAAVSLFRAHRALRQAREGLMEESNLKFVSRAYAPAIDTGFEAVSTPALFSRAAEFNGHFYVAGQTGLFEYDDRGHELRTFLVGRELPPSPLLRV